MIHWSGSCKQLRHLSGSFAAGNVMSTLGTLKSREICPQQSIYIKLAQEAIDTVMNNACNHYIIAKECKSLSMGDWTEAAEAPRYTYCHLSFTCVFHTRKEHGFPTSILQPLLCSKSNPNQPNGHFPCTQTAPSGHALFLPKYIGNTLKHAISNDLSALRLTTDPPA